MRTALVTSLTLAALASVAAPARADDIVGVYAIKIEEMGNNCSPSPITLSAKTVRIDVKGGSLTVNLDTVPQMVGSAGKNGRVSARTLKVAPTTFGGLDGKYSVAGHVAPDKAIELVLVAEYSRSDTKKPYCTQSWTLTGKPAAP